MDATSAEAARKDFRHLLDVAHYQGSPTVITKFGQDWAAITPLDVLQAAHTVGELQAQLATEQARATTLAATCTQHTQALARALELIEGLRTHLPAGTDPVLEEHYVVLHALLAEPVRDDQLALDHPEDRSA